MEGYISRAKSDYEGILASGQCRWLTVSPPHNDWELEQYYELWMYILYPLVQFSRDLLLLVEMSKDLRLHFHCFYSTKDRVKEYRYLNGWRKQSMVRAFDGEPKGGFDYLVKDLEFTAEFLPTQLLLLNRSQLSDQYQSVRKTVEVNDLVNKYRKSCSSKAR